MCHISGYQHEKLAELRAELGEKLLNQTPLYNDTFSLLRWLQGWNFKIGEIVPRFKRASAVFHCLGINALPLLENVDDLNDYVRSLSPTGDFMPGGVLGFDRDGNILTLQLFGQFHFKKLMKCSKNSDGFRISIVETALIYKLLLNEERKRGRKLGFVGIVDVEGCNSEHLSAITHVRPLMQTMQELFPDILHKGYLINTMPLIKTAFNMVKRWMPEQSREKIFLLDSDYHGQLIDGIGEDSLPPKLGGNFRPSRGHPEFGTLRLGGEPPKTLTYSRHSNALHMEDEALEKVTVPARQKREILISAPDDCGQYLLHWFWYCSSDVDFGIFDEEGEEIWPMFRLVTDQVPEYGTIGMEGGRKYKLILDNQFSVFSRKEVRIGWRLEKVDGQ